MWNPVTDWTVPLDANDAQSGRVGRLDRYGEEQAFAFGRKLRQRYGNFLKDTYDATEVRAVSSGRGEARRTGQLVLGGLYSNVGDDFDSLDQSTLGNFGVSGNARLLRIRDSECGSSQAAWDSVLKQGTELPFVQRWFSIAEGALLRVSEAYADKTIDLPFLRDLTDNVIGMRYLRLTYPEWLRRPEPRWSGSRCWRR